MQGGSSVIHVELLTKIASMCPINPWHTPSSVLSSSHCDVQDIPHFMSFHRGFKSAAARLFLTLNEKDKIESQRAPAEQLRSRTRDGKNWAFIIGHAAPVKIAIAAVERERVRGPAV